MTVPPQQPYAQSPGTQTVVYPQPSNNLGLAGFITSLVGLVTCGVLSPIGLVLSLIGLRKQPRGLAIAGAVIGLIGSIFMVVAGIGIVMGLMGLGKAAEAMGKYITTQQTARQAYLQLDQQRKQGSTLDSTKATAVAAQHKDAWGTPMRAQLTGGTIVILSAGPDKAFDNDDDIRFEESELQATTFPSTQGSSGDESNGTVDGD